MTAELIEKFDAFRQLSQSKLTRILDSIIGKKDIVIDGSLMKPLERFIGVKALREHGVCKIFKLDKKDTVAENASVVYLIRSDLITAKRICDQIQSSTAQRHFHIVAVPNIFHSLEVLVEEEGLFGKITLHSLSWELIHLDTRLLSFESPEIFKFFFVARDPTYTVPVAKSLWALQHIFGKVPVKMFIGPFSKQLHYMANVLDTEKGEPDSSGADIGLMIVADRDVDYASTLLTPGTYTSLVADTVGINTGIVEIVKENDGKTTMQLTSQDETYNQIKHKFFSHVITHLKHKISEFYSEQGKRNNMTVQQMRDFVKNDLSKTANYGRTLSQHLNICERVMNKIGQLYEGIQTCQHDILNAMSRRECITFIEDIISTAKDMNLALRLICLLSLCQNGFTTSEASSLKMQFFHSYGHEHILTFHNLEKMGLFTTTSIGVDIPANIASKVAQAVSYPRKGVFQSTAAKLKLFPDTISESETVDPQNAGYVFGGLYIPVLVQVLTMIVKKERTLREITRYLPGEGSDTLIVGSNLDSTPDINPRCILVYILGGITYAEIAAFELLEKKTGCRIICAGSSIITGNDVVQSAI